MSSSRVQISLNRTPHPLRNQRTFCRIVAERAATEAAPHVALVERDLRLGNTECLRHRFARLVRRLAALPNVHLVAVDAHDGVQGLHLRVVAVVAAELGPIGLGRAGESHGDVALFLDRNRRSVWVVMDADIIRKRALGIKTVGLGLCPGNFQRVARLDRILEVLGYHRQSIRQCDDIDHALHAAHFCIVPLFRTRVGGVLKARIPRLRLCIVHGGMKARGIHRPFRAAARRWRTALNH
jgi:hypothetical protein